jgi:hypothetical protein
VRRAEPKSKTRPRARRVTPAGLYFVYGAEVFRMGRVRRWCLRFYWWFKGL